MKNYYLIYKAGILSIGLVYCCEISIAQDNIETSKIYEVRSNIAAYPCDVLGNLDTTQNKIKSYSIPPYNAKFALIKILDTHAIIRFLNWSDSTTNTDSYKHTLAFNVYLKKERISNVFSQDDPRYRVGDTTIKVQRYFYILRNDLDSNCIKVYQTWKPSFTLGLVTMPLKLRISPNFDFQGNFSLGTTAGGKFRISKYNSNYVDLLFGLAISTVSLDSFSTKGKVPGQPLSNIAAFSPSVGVVLEFGKSQFGVFYGYDLLSKSTQSKYNWIYNGKPWISIGFGFSILSITSQSSPSSTVQNSASSK